MLLPSLIQNHKNDKVITNNKQIIATSIIYWKTRIITME